jgi:uncharacterized membrane protein
VDVKTSAIRWVSVIPGALMLVIGLVWALQGIGLLRGSVMTGQAQWLVIGVVVGVVGVWLLFRGLRRQSNRAG